MTTLKIDTPISDFQDFLKPFSAVVAGPGPGDPRRSKDVGWIRELWKLEGQALLPVLGICLGFQSLVLAFGGTIDRLGEPRHGVVRRVRGTRESIFRNVEHVETVQYHSLYASLGPNGRLERKMSHGNRDLSLKCSDLRPLAWDYEVDNAAEGVEGAVPLNSRRILMAVEHKTKPFIGIQFHAESICSNSEARKVVETWWEVAKKWRRPSQDIRSLASPPRTPYSDFEAFQYGISLPNHQRAADDIKTSSISGDGIRSATKKQSNLGLSLKRCNGGFPSQSHDKGGTVDVVTHVIDVEDKTVPSICEILDVTSGEAIILDSERHQRHDVGEYSIIGLVSPDSLRIEYQVGTNEVRRIYNGRSKTSDLGQSGRGIFSYLKSFMAQYKVHKSDQNVPFWGGLMGFISYEACLETIGIVHSPCRTGKSPQRPDLSFVFVERSIVVDHNQKKIHIQTIKRDDHDWVDRTTLRLKGTEGTIPSSRYPISVSSNAQMSLLNAAFYKSKIRSCQSAIRAGDSYELCLTTQSSIHTRKRPAAWPLYLRLRSLNPAPFSAYVRFGKLTLLSSSPERFLQWLRPTKSSESCMNGELDSEEKTIRCQFRPIKGTVQRQPDPNLPPLTLAEATALLATPKERAENLMIVDLIRHDLHGVVGSGRVSVPKLMVVEEYATLFQLVSVVEGSLALEDENSPEDDLTVPCPTNSIRNPSTAKTGLDILAASLPPGSMTGAPKLRSCQLLHTLESRPRGIYSGVLGYLDIGGGGDFSVVIRSAVRWDSDASEAADGEGELVGNDDNDDDRDEWTIGAGGAVTSMSTEDGEWEEMCAKMRSTLRLFEGP